MSGLIPLGWTAQNRALGFGRQNLKGRVSLTKHHEQGKQQTTLPCHHGQGSSPLREGTPPKSHSDLKVTDFLIEPKGDFSTIPYHHVNVCMHMGRSHQLVLVFIDIFPRTYCLWHKILLPWSKAYSVLMLQKYSHALVSLKRPTQFRSTYIWPFQSSETDVLTLLILVGKYITAVLSTDLTNYRLQPSDTSPSTLDINWERIGQAQSTLLKDEIICLNYL